MYGIAGIISDSSEKINQYLALSKDVLNNNMPDNSQSVIKGNCGLTHTRLSILDLESEQQPIKSSMQDVYLIFYGEIYGHKDLRKQLSTDYNFVTQSDSEIILALYQKYDEDFLQHLPGCFSFALFDNTKKKLICARDRFGEKPFYYAKIDNGFVFASEIRTIVKSGLITPQLNTDAVAHFLQFEYINPLYSVYSNIHVLPPAHKLIHANGNFTVTRYWDTPATNWDIDYETAKEQFDHLLQAAVAKQMIADVPVGVFLSGGLDSSTITYLASKHTTKLKTFAFKLSARDNMDHLYAEQVAKLYNTEHIVLDSSDYDFVDLLQKMPDVYDEPIADQACMLKYIIIQEVKKHTSVVLGGDGADTLLASCTGQVNVYNPNVKISAPGLKFIRNLLGILPEQQTNLLKYLHKKHIFLDLEDFYYHYPTYSRSLHDADIIKLFKTYAKSQIRPISSLDDIYNVGLHNQLVGKDMVKINGAAAYFGCRERSPFLEQEFAEFSMSLPLHMKLKQEPDKTVTEKLILRDVYADKWPLDIQNREKRGFGPPPFDNKKLYELANEYLVNNNKKMFSFINYAHVKKMLGLVNQDNFVHDNALMRILQLSIWSQKWL